MCVVVSGGVTERYERMCTSGRKANMEENELYFFKHQCNACKRPQRAARSSTILLARPRIMTDSDV